MIRLILAVAFALLTAVLGAFLALNPGHASFEFLGMQTEMPFVVAAGLVILFAFLMLVVWWGIYMLWTSPDKVKGFMGRRRREQGYDALEKALIASAAGDGEAAVRQAARADALWTARPCHAFWPPEPLSLPAILKAHRCTTKHC